MANKLNLQTIFSAVDKLSGPSKTMQGSVAKSTASMEKSFKAMGNAAKLAGFALLTAATVGVVSLGKKGLELASDLTEVQNVVDTTFGKEGSSKINAWAQTAIKAYGLSELQAKKFNGTMGAMLKSSGLTGTAIVSMSQGLSGLAGDFSSFYNLDAQDAFDKIRAGISGETEPLKQLGINMSVANLEAFALTQRIKKKWSAMSQGEQVQLRYNYLLKASADAQGDFAKTLETSYANQKRVLITQIEQAAARAMSSALPIALKLATRLNSVVEKITLWIDANKELIGQKIESTINLIAGAGKLLADGWNSGLIPAVLAAVAAYKVLMVTMVALPAVIGALKTITFALAAVQGGAATAGEVLNMVLSANPAGLVCVAIATLVGLTVLMIKHWSTLGPILANVGQTIIKFLLVPVNLVTSAIVMLLKAASHIPGIGGALGNVAGILESSQSKMNNTLTGSAGTFDYGGVWNTPVSSNTTGIESRSVSESRSSLDVNFNSMPAGTTTRQTGNAPGITVNTMPAFGGAR